MTVQDYQALGVFRIRFEIIDAENIDQEVFLYRRHPPDPYTGDEKDEFCAIASPVDLVEYPINAPDINKDFPFLRKNFADLLFRSTSEAEAAKEEIITQLNVLLDALCRADQLNVAQDIWIPSPPGLSASASASGSVSVP
jgi:hypothetical protein